MSINSKQKGSDFMSLLEKITDALLSKNWILTVLSFVISVIISIFVPAEIYDKLPFDSKINVIIGFVAIALCVFLVLYFFVWIIGKKYRKSLMEGERARIKNEETEDAIEEWRCFFDQLSDEEYSILMFFVITKINALIKDGDIEWTISKMVPFLRAAWKIKFSIRQRYMRSHLLT